MNHPSARQKTTSCRVLLIDVKTDLRSTRRELLVGPGVARHEREQEEGVRALGDAAVDLSLQGKHVGPELVSVSKAAAGYYSYLRGVVVFFLFRVGCWCWRLGAGASASAGASAAGAVVVAAACSVSSVRAFFAAGSSVLSATASVVSIALIFQRWLNAQLWASSCKRRLIYACVDYV